MKIIRSLSLALLAQFNPLTSTTEWFLLIIMPNNNNKIPLIINLISIWNNFYQWSKASILIEILNMLHYPTVEAKANPVANLLWSAAKRHL